MSHKSKPKTPGSSPKKLVQSNQAINTVDLKLEDEDALKRLSIVSPKVNKSQGSPSRGVSKPISNSRLKEISRNLEYKGSQYRDGISQEKTSTPASSYATRSVSNRESLGSSLSQTLGAEVCGQLSSQGGNTLGIGASIEIGHTSKVAENAYSENSDEADEGSQEAESDESENDESDSEYHAEESGPEGFGGEESDVEVVKNEESSSEADSESEDSESEDLESEESENEESLNKETYFEASEEGDSNCEDSEEVEDSEDSEDEDSEDANGEESSSEADNSAINQENSSLDLEISRSVPPTIEAKSEDFGGDISIYDDNVYTNGPYSACEVSGDSSSENEQSIKVVGATSPRVQKLKMENDIIDETESSEDDYGDGLGQIVSHRVRIPPWSSYYETKFYTTRNIKEILSICNSNIFFEREDLQYESFIKHVKLDRSFFEGLRSVIYNNGSFGASDFENKHIYKGCRIHFKIPSFYRHINKSVCSYCLRDGFISPEGHYTELFKCKLRFYDEFDDILGIPDVTSFNEITEKRLLPFESLSAENISNGLVPSEMEEFLQDGGMLDQYLHDSTFNIYIKTNKFSSEFYFPRPSHVLEGIERVENFDFGSGSRVKSRYE
ncbi:Halomucin [Wickerhamomyces ciferrii]|uniref:Halomucin n=1 Tax=Wickerhamomyces ciferrii (strain ATCC 14091 / BCRC 22168 / CBS 111 / JCM 3599 / NBRC 0793 / NRRL Y-1031 F-60-10) TaxID=1206466 RepID=K0KI51_WICCF|nr:Halomucin [Wickerhamomyces ciferrii]CCH41084.1 Halomucin [Wickerhamomyces ciferrii]